VKSLYEVRIIDVAILCENAHLKYFVFGDTTGPAKVSRVRCRRILRSLIKYPKITYIRNVLIPFTCEMHNHDLIATFSENLFKCLKFVTY